MHDREYIISIIEAIRNSIEGLDYAYQNGGCYQFHLILKSIFPNAVPWHTGFPEIIEHVLTEIDGRFYDITGHVSVSHIKLFGFTDEKHERASDFAPWKDWQSRKAS